jgi:hypothetical protein
LPKERPRLSSLATPESYPGARLRPVLAAVTAQIGALRASVHEQLRQRGIDPTSPECEQTWLLAGGTLGRLLASPETTALPASVADDEQRCGIAALLLWAAGISPHAETVTR